MFDLKLAFADDGLLVQKIKGFKPRPAQLEMALAVEQAIQDKTSLIAEAGTGTGKTFAYLIPAIASAKRVIISTGTKNLQDQLFFKDLPIMRKALALPFQAALLKGRNNYLCTYRLKHVLAFKAGHGRSDAALIERVKRWAANTQTGDIAEVADVPEASPIWPAVTSSADNCLGQDCPDFNDCFLMKARRKVQESEIVVINHHLLWADWMLKSEGFGELLPDVDAIIVDEAHQFAETAAQFLGLSITSRQLNELASDTVTEQLNGAGDQPEIGLAADKLEKEVDNLRNVFGLDARREAWSSVDEAVIEQLKSLTTVLKELSLLLGEAQVRSKGLESCFKRSEEIHARLNEFLQDELDDAVRWFETHKRSFSLNRTPLDISEIFSKFHNVSKAAWVFTSATLSVSTKFDHFQSALGLHQAKAYRWESPFDYQNQSLFYLPTDLPDPSSNSYTHAVVQASVPVLKASQGRAFMLFTSKQAMEKAADLLKDLVEYPLFIQGDQPKSALLQAFKQAGNGILLGTASFWEGVDVQGSALSCVIIDKLPFASPSDPVLNARLEVLKKKGLSPFGCYQLPTAVIALKQGVGRLIRSHDDKGVLMLCDPRLVSKSYGKVFLNSLPPMRRTRMLNKVEAFYKNIEVSTIHP